MASWNHNITGRVQRREGVCFLMCSLSDILACGMLLKKTGADEGALLLEIHQMEIRRMSYEFFPPPKSDLRFWL